jgi:non-specific serine/threonine protein kinase
VAGQEATPAAERKENLQLRPNTLTARLLDSLPLVAEAPQAAHNRGWNLFYGHAVQVVYAERRQACLQVNERGEKSRVTIALGDGQISVACDCPQSRSGSSEICRHKVAAVLRLQAELRARPIETWETALAGVLKQPPRPKASPSRYVLLFGLLDDYSGWHLAAFRLSVRHLPADIPGDNAALSAWMAKNMDVVREAKIIRTVSDLSSFTNAGEDVAQFAHMLGLASQGYYPYNASSDFAFGTVLPRIAGFPLFRGKNSGYDRSLASPLTMVAGSITPTARLDETENGLRLQLEMPLAGAPVAGQVEIVSEDPLWLISGDRLLSIKDAGTAFLPLLTTPDVTIPREDEDDFLNEYLAPLAERVTLTGSAVTWEDTVATLEKRLYLTEAEDGIAARLLFAYGEQEVAYDKDPPEESIRVKPGTRTLVRLRRDIAAEQKAYESLNGFGLKRGREPGVFVLRAKTHPVDFLLHQVPRLAENGFTVFGEEELASARVNRNTPTLSFNVSSGIDWFDVGAVAHFGNLEVSLRDIRRAVRKKERYIKLADGTIGALPAEFLEKYGRLFAFSEETDDGLRLGNAQVTLLDQVLGDAEGFEADDEFARRRDRLRDFNSIVPHELPRGLDAELRPYQKAGFDWLHFLHEYGFGGCLADDMGLGKTLETLAFLLSLREEGHADAPDLIVMPRSLLFNWQREAARFTPSLRIHIHADKDRATDLDELDQYDLVLTTYGVMLRDIETLRKKRFHYAVLDESQAIKNPLSKTARAARLLKPDHRLALTGTPVENSTAELWSQFAFLNPGLLGALDNFRSEFTTPIERHQNAEAADFLRKMVYPFILRRTKAQVAP